MNDNPPGDSESEGSNGVCSSIQSRESRRETSVQHGLKGESDTKDILSRSERTEGSAEPPMGELSSTQNALIQLIDYVHALVKLAGRPVWSLAAYHLVLHEQELRNRIGIRHDLRDEDGP
ncbi:MAG: hypothetical protein ACREQX_15300, partial [Candidatus Binataceae bacterium]